VVKVIDYMNGFSVTKFREHFPILSEKVEGNALVYFDNGATTQKPQCVIETEQHYYQNINANVHRGTHHLSIKATTAFEKARVSVQQFINASSSKEIIWTKGTTESINLVAQTWGRANLKANDEIVLTYAEHHANVVPWQLIAEQTGAIIKVLPLKSTGIVDDSQLDDVINSRTKIVSVTHISNVVGKINPIEKIIKKAKSVGAITFIDGAQAIAHLAIDVRALDCVFYSFSAHKAYGPTGIGVLYGKVELLEKMPVYQSGGEMISKVSFSGTTFNELPFKFEAGTPNIAGVIAFESAISFIENHQLNQTFKHKKQLVEYCFEQLSKINNIKFLVKEQPDIPIFSFVINNHHQQDIAVSLDNKGIAVRVGHHCAMPLMEYLKASGCIRISLAPYNTLAEVDYFIAQLKIIIKNDGADDNDFDAAQPTINISADQGVLAKFSQLNSWDAKHRAIMLLGKSMQRMPKNLRLEESLITGCESAAWLTVHQSAEGVFSFEADSDAKIIRGLLVIVLAAFNNKTAEQIITFKIEEYFQQLGLIKHLSPSRGNGLLAIVKKIKECCL